jgi:hypothetical protein
LSHMAIKHMEMSFVAIFVIKLLFLLCHLGSKDFQCEDFGKKFTLRRSLKQYVDIFHLQPQ